MSKGDKKMAVLSALKQHRDPISMIGLLAMLGDEFAERSVRRWLTQLTEEGKILKTGHKRGTRYQAVTFNFSKNSLDAISFIKQPIFDRPHINYQMDWLDAYKPNITFYLPESMRTKMASKGKHASHEERADTYVRKIYNRLLINLSFNSSRLEGNTYSLLDTERLLLKGIEAKGKLNEEKIMIINHKETIRHLIDNTQKLQIDFKEICTIHYLLSDGLIEPEKSGHIRNEEDKITGTQYFPIANKEKIEIQLEKICNTANQINDPFEQSFFLLVHLAYLQGFSDINKRTSRLSANIPLLKNNLPPLSFNDIKKDDYIDAMFCIYEVNNTNPLSELYQFSYLRSCKAYDVHAQEIGYDEIRVKHRRTRRELLSTIIKERLLGKQLDKFLEAQAKEKIPPKDHEAFINTVMEDLELLSPQRIAGLGITKHQLQAYLEASNEHME